MSAVLPYKNLSPDHLPVPIVAIGGSAGGQQAILELLSHLSVHTGLAYVYIQHLSPTYDSKLDVILSAATSMPVLEARQSMHVLPNHLYIIPPNKDMEIIDGVLSLMPRKPKPQPHLPIDQFFISLSERQKDGAIGIVLSGMASDGTLGLKAIKVAGGVTFAQDISAEFQSMPQSAIKEGVVDMILSPKEMAAELLRLSKKSKIFKLTRESQESQQDDISDDDLTEILLYLKSAISVDFSHYKKSTIRRRIIRRMLLFKLETLRQYTLYLKQHPSEPGMLYNDLLINVTDFFRDKETMVYLEKIVFPAMIKKKLNGESLRIWVAACSTGQEAYSLAIMMAEIRQQLALDIPIQIFATDLSETAIVKARLGIYTKSEIAGVPPRHLKDFFTLTDQNYRINKSIRDLCIFAPHNLLTDPPFSRIDLVSCRNLLIYLDDTLQRRILATFHYALKPDSVLLLGKSEAIGSAPSHFLQIEKTYKIFTRKNAHARIAIDLVSRKKSFVSDRQTNIVKNKDTTSAGDLDKLVDNLLLSKYVPASIVIDQDLEIIQFRGSTSLFLEPSPGKASLNLAKMARPPLVFDLRNIIHKARKSGEPVSKSGLEVKVNGKTHFVKIEAVPIINAENHLFVILFEEVKENELSPERAGGDADKRNLMLEAELSAVRQDMHSIIEEQEAGNEELQAANEEIVSSNEELQSINEELETSKEEIESANEELLTINKELQERNEQLTESYEYSEAILSTINEATLVLDNQLKIKSANQAFYKIFSVVSKDTEGKMLYELDNRKLDFPGLRQLLEDVISRNEHVKGFEIDVNLTDVGNKTMLLHARKAILYRKETILLVFEDITEHRKVQKMLLERQ